MKKSKKILLIIVILVVVAGIGCFSWWKLYKIPYDQAVVSWNAAVSAIQDKNSVLESKITEVQDTLNSGDKPYDENIINNVSTVVAEAQQAEVKIPDMPEKTAAITAAVAQLNTNIDYSEQILALDAAKKSFEDSVQQLKQITNPDESFVVLRLQQVDGVTGVQAATEDNDPNGQLHKNGGYTAAVYFTYADVDQSKVFTSGSGDIVDKGTEGGGQVEVYADEDDANKRNDYLSAYDGGPFASGSHTVAGTCVIRTSDLLTASQQQDLTQRIIQALTALE